jgi:glycosyl transferase family 25
MPPWKINEIPAECISLKRREDRWDNFNSQPAVRELPMLERYDAVDGKTLDLATDKRILLSAKRNIMNKQRRSHEELDSIGGVGCALSHIGIWQKMVQHQIPLMFVIEDDARIPSEFVAKANEMIASSPALQDYNSWDLWVLSNNQLFSKPLPGEPKVHDLQAFVTTTGYVITLKCAEKFLADAFPIHCHIDYFMVILKQVRPMRYLSTPSFRIYQRGDKSDIQEKPGCIICNVPTDFDTTHAVISKADRAQLFLAQNALIIGASLIVGYGFYRHFVAKD